MGVPDLFFCVKVRQNTIDLHEPLMIALIPGRRATASTTSKKEGKFESKVLHGSENRTATYLSTWCFRTGS